MLILYSKFMLKSLPQRLSVLCLQCNILYNYFLYSYVPVAFSQHLQWLLNKFLCVTGQATACGATVP